MAPPPPQPAVLPPARVLVAGATGWLGSAVVAELARRGYEVTALVRDPSSAAALKLLSESSSLGGGAAGGTKTGKGGSVSLAQGDVTDEQSLQRATNQGSVISAVISCVGMRDLAVPDAEIEKVLKTGTLNLGRAAAAAGASLFVAVAGGIHRLRDGSVNREMVHNRMREEALEELARRRAEAEAEKEREEAERKRGSDGEEEEDKTSSSLPPAVVAIDPSVFFKDAATIFSMINKSLKEGKGGKRKQEGRLTLVEGSWAVRCNPVSARDLAARLADALADQRRERPEEVTPPLLPASSASASPVRRFRVGGPQVLSFAELADEAGRALGGEIGEGGGETGIIKVAHASLPRPLARALYSAASFFSLFGLRRALAAKRFLSFLWVVGTDESPGSLVGDERCGGDTLSAFFAELAAEERRRKRLEEDKR